MIARRLRHHDAEGVGEERRAPELDAVRACTAALRPLVPDAVHRGDEETVRDRVRTLDRAPGVELLGAVLLPLVRVPADCRGIEKNVGALQRRQSRALRVPLVPADERPDPPHLRVERAKPEVTRREVELLVVGRVVGDVHFSVQADEAAVRVDHRRGVVVQSRRAPLEHGRDYDHACSPGDLSQRLRARPGHGLGEVEQGSVLHLSEVARAEQLGETDESRTLACRLFQEVDRVLQVLVRIRGHRHLDEPHLVLRRWPGVGHGTEHIIIFLPCTVP